MIDAGTVTFSKLLFEELIKMVLVSNLAADFALFCLRASCCGIVKGLWNGLKASYLWIIAYLVDLSQGLSREPSDRVRES